ncbi:microsomal triglyceride transfer protein large subunit-like [Watersipora subatra]|uniref:microsomal triglyceride transfer protein large subunit-like n=1 Tax=Watersipora subatra TaxID=2589382 RepID=UPI00355ACE9C
MEGGCPADGGRLPCLGREGALCSREIVLLRERGCLVEVGEASALREAGCYAKVKQNDVDILALADVAQTLTMAKAMMSPPKDRTELKNSLTVVITGLENGQYTKEEMDTLSHALTNALDVKEPVTEPVKDVELHGMIGKKPLHVSSEFLGETLSAISIRPDGLKRYSYKSLINPDLTKVEGVVGTPEKQMGRRLSMLSDAHIATAGMTQFGEEERSRRRSSLPTKDFVLQGIPNPVDEEDDEQEEDVWEASMHEVKITNSVHINDIVKEQDKLAATSHGKASSNKNNSSLDEMEKGQLLSSDQLGNEHTEASDESEYSKASFSQSLSPGRTPEGNDEQMNNNAHLKGIRRDGLVQVGCDITKTPPSLSECDTHKQVHEDAIVDTSLHAEVAEQKASLNTDSDSSVCPVPIGESDSYTPSLTPPRKTLSYPKPSKPGGAKVVKKVTRPKPAHSDAAKRVLKAYGADNVKGHSTVAELANSYAKAMSRQSAALKTKAKSTSSKKSSATKLSRNPHISITAGLTAASREAAMTSRGRRACLAHVILCFVTASAGPVRPSSATCAIHFDAGKIYNYHYTTDVSLNEANDQKGEGAHRAVGYSLEAELKLSVVWKKSYDYLFRLDVVKSTLHSVSRSGVNSDFKELRKYPVFFHWSGDGKIGRVYLPMDESTIAANIKKGIISMLQLQTVDGERTEVDASGECYVEYQIIGNKVTKKKSNCKNLEKSGQYSPANKAFDSSQLSITSTTFEFANDIITYAEAVDKQVVFLNGDRAVDMVAKARQVLKLGDVTKGATTVQAGGVEEAVEAVDPAEYDLIGMLLGTDVDSATCLLDCVSLSDAIKELQEDLQVTKVAKLESPKAFLKLIPIVRQSSKDNIKQALADNKNIVLQLLDVVAAAQTDSAVYAAMEYLEGETDYRVAERFIMASSFASHPRESLLKALLGLFREKTSSPELHQSIALALGAVTRSYCKVGEQCSSQVVQDIEKTLISSLNEAKDSSDSLKVVRAMRNARLHGTTKSLIKLVKTANDSAVVSAAVQALAALTEDSTSVEVLDTMSRIYHQSDRLYDSSIRSAALAVLLSVRPSVQEIRNVMLSTVNQTDKHLSTYVQGAMKDLAKQQPSFSTKFMEALNDTRIRNYYSLSPGGKANALTSLLGKSEYTDVSYRLFMQNAQTGIMKKSGMQVNLQAGVLKQPLILFSIYAQGMESFVDSSAVPKGMEPEDPSAGLSLDLLDVLLRPVEFFRGQAALMSAVWNAPSQPVTALAMNVITQDKSQTIYLQNGVVLQHNLLGAASIEISGFISISLWNQDAHSVLKNSGATVVTGNLGIANNNYLSASVNFDLSAAAFIDFITDVNFYVTPPQLCLRMSLDPFTVRQNWRKIEKAVGFSKKATYTMKRSLPVSGGSYLLSPENSRECTKLLEK